MSSASFRTRVFRLALVAPALAACAEMSDDDVGAERTRFVLTVEHVGGSPPYVKSGSFAAIPPGGSAEIVFTAGRGQTLTFATMFVESNDFFYAPVGAGLPLYDADGAPISGDVTANVELWDAGTEVNQEPGIGPDQAPRQGEPGQGAPDPHPWARLAPDDFGNLPRVEDVVRATLVPGPDQRFTLRLENVSDATTLGASDGSYRAVPLSAGAWALHEGSEPVFTLGAIPHQLEIERLAEDGDETLLTVALTERTGLTVPLSPGAWLVHRDEGALFEAPGLEEIAEDGDPAEIEDALARRFQGGRFGVFEDGPIVPGEASTFAVQAAPGERLSFATMFVQSNDVFLAPGPEGLALFDDDGAPRAGDVTAELDLWDAGTELNQEPGIGNDQAPRQLTPGAGPVEDVPVERLRDRPDGFGYPTVEALVRVTLAPE